MILITTTINSSSSIRNRFEKLTMTTIGTLGANLGNTVECRFSKRKFSKETGFSKDFDVSHFSTNME